MAPPRPRRLAAAVGGRGGRGSWLACCAVACWCCCLVGGSAAGPEARPPSGQQAARLRGGGRAADGGLPRLGPWRTPLQVKEAISVEDLGHLRSLLDGGHPAACCGYWQDAAAQRLTKRLARALGVDMRQLGDVHFSNASSHVATKTDPAEPWGAIVIAYLDDENDEEGVERSSSSSAVLQRQHVAGATQEAAGSDEGQVVEAARRSVILVPTGMQLTHRTTRRVAWLHLRRPGQPPRTSFDYYVVSGVRAYLVAPHDTARQRHLFGAWTRHPRYWHAFMWSFAGMMLTCLMCLPLGLRAMRFVEEMLFPSDGASGRSLQARPSSPRKPVQTVSLRQRWQSLWTKRLSFDSVGGIIGVAPVFGFANSETWV